MAEPQTDPDNDRKKMSLAQRAGLGLIGAIIGAIGGYFTIGELFGLIGGAFVVGVGLAFGLGGHGPGGGVNGGGGDGGGG